MANKYSKIPLPRDRVGNHKQFTMQKKSSDANLGKLGLVPSSAKLNKRINPMGDWCVLYSQGISRSGLSYLREKHKNQLAHIQLNEQHYAQMSVRASLCINDLLMHYENLPTQKLYEQRFDEDIKSAQKLGQLEGANAKICHFVQATYPNEALQLKKSVAFLANAADWPDRWINRQKYVLWQIRHGHRQAQDMIGYRFFFFDIDHQKYDLRQLFMLLEQCGLESAIAGIVESSPKKFHVYLKVDITATAHWQLDFAPSETIRENRLLYKKIWHRIAKVLDADVGDNFIQKAQSPEYMNPKTNWRATLVYDNPNAWTPSLSDYKRIVKERLGGMVSMQPVPRHLIEPGTPLSVEHYLATHNLENEFDYKRSVHSRVKLLLRYVWKHHTLPLSSELKNQWFNRIISPSFSIADQEEAERQFSHFLSKQTSFANRYQALEPKPPEQVFKIDQFLQQWQLKIVVEQGRKKALTQQQFAKIDRFIKQVRIALTDPYTSLSIEGDKLVGKIPCKFLKGRHNGLGRYAELTRGIEKLGLLVRAARYIRPYKTPEGWQGEARKWTLHLTPLAKPKVLPSIFNISYDDATRHKDIPCARPPYYDDYVTQYHNWAA